MDGDSLQPYLGIAVSILATQETSALQNLKDFLVAMPSAKQIEQTLGLAVVQLAERNPPAFEWVLLHREMLMPEIDLQEFAKQLVIERLCAQGWTQGKDFNLAVQPPFFRKGRSVIFPSQYFSEGERQFLTSVL